jgi:hypothetical protein
VLGQIRRIGLGTAAAESTCRDDSGAAPGLSGRGSMHLNAGYLY